MFLNKPYTEHPIVNVIENSRPPLVCIHSTMEGGKPITRLYRSIPERLEFAANPPILSNNAAHVIWLSGYPSPDWMNFIGAQYRVDPEFFRRHLIFLQSKDNHNIDVMPSSTQRMITIRLTTICRRSIALCRADIEQARNEAASSVRLHQQRLRVGDSIVRRYLVFDNTTFTVEQKFPFMWSAASIIMVGLVLTLLYLGLSADCT